MEKRWLLGKEELINKKKLLQINFKFIKRNMKNKNKKNLIKQKHMRIKIDSNLKITWGIGIKVRI